MRDQDSTARGGDRDVTGGQGESRSTVPNDLPDNERDAQRLQGEETTIDLPDVQDIPGQEFIHAPSLGELADTTISSDDEEGTRIFGDEDDNGAGPDRVSNVDRGERKALDKDDYMPTGDADSLNRARMDDEDFGGEDLNEKSF